MLELRMLKTSIEDEEDEDEGADGKMKQKPKYYEEIRKKNPRNMRMRGGREGKRKRGRERDIHRERVGGKQEWWNRRFRIMERLAKQEMDRKTN